MGRRRKEVRGTSTMTKVELRRMPEWTAEEP